MPPARRAPVVLKARVGRREAKERNVAAIPKEEQEKEEKNITENEEIGRLLWGEDSRRRSGGTPEQSCPALYSQGTPGIGGWAFIVIDLKLITPNPPPFGPPLRRPDLTTALSDWH